MNKKLIAIAVLSLACTGASAESLVEGSIDAGKAKAVVCGACHGIDGNSVNPEWPVLAGQHAKYTVKQLSAFKEGLRQNALMSGQAMALSEEDMRNLAVYFEAQTPGARSVADPDLVAKRLASPVMARPVRATLPRPTRSSADSTRSTPPSPCATTPAARARATVRPA